jgi:hypothetical protein
MNDKCVAVGPPTEALFVIFKPIARSHSATNVQQFTSALPGPSRTFNDEQSGSSIHTPGLVRSGQVTMAVIAAEEKQISSNRLVPAPCQGDAQILAQDSQTGEVARRESIKYFSIEAIKSLAVKSGKKIQARLRIMVLASAPSHTQITTGTLHIRASVSSQSFRLIQRSIPVVQINIAGGSSIHNSDKVLPVPHRHKPLLLVHQRMQT